MRGGAGGVVIAVVLVGCGRPMTPEEHRADVARTARAQLVAPTCTPETSDMKACGLISSEPDMTEAVFRRRLIDRYDRASMRDVSSRCDGQCSTFIGQERVWLYSHNEQVLLDAERELTSRPETRPSAAEATTSTGSSSTGSPVWRDALRVISAGLGGFLDGARAAAPTGSCGNSYGCPPGYTCMISSGATMGQCMAPR